jgi:chromosome segregation ATPase
MLKNKLFVSAFLVIALAAFLWGYFSRQQQSPNPGLKEQLEKIILENQQLKEVILEANNKVSQLSLELKQKESDLLTLSNPQALKNALSVAQATISQLSVETERASQEKEATEENYFNTNSRLQVLSAELSRSREELKVTKKSLNDLQKKKEVNYQLNEKERRITQLEAEVEKLKTAKVVLQDQSSVRDKSIKELNALNQNLKNQISQFPVNLGQQQGLVNRQNQEAGTLREELVQSQIKLAALQNQLLLRENELARVREELKRQPAQSASRQAGQDYSAILRQLDETKRLYESAKLQTSQFYEILASKEIELNNQKREAQTLKQRVAELEAKLSGLDAGLKTAKFDTQRTRAIEVEKLELEAKYLKAQADLEKQDNLIAILSNNLDSLNKKISQKEDEKKNLEENILKTNLAKTSLEEELERKKQQLDELNDFYAGLKTQIIQFSSLLSEKEAELREKEKQSQDLKTEIAYQESKVTNLERDLVDTKERQKKILENISQVTNINAELQQKLSGVAQSLEQEDLKQEEEKKKAEELKRKVEVILLPEEGAQ